MITRDKINDVQADLNELQDDLNKLVCQTENIERQKVVIQMKQNVQQCRLFINYLELLIKADDLNDFFPEDDLPTTIRKLEELFPKPAEGSQ